MAIVTRIVVHGDINKNSWIACGDDDDIDVFTSRDDELSGRAAEQRRRSKRAFHVGAGSTTARAGTDVGDIARETSCRACLSSRSINCRESTGRG